MRAAVDGIDPDPVHGHFHPAQRGDRIHQEQSAAVVGDGGQILQRLTDSGRSLGVHHGEHFHFAAPDGLPHRFRVNRPAPRRIDSHELPAKPADNVRHPCAEDSVHTHHDFVARLNQIDETGLHASAARPRDRYGELVARLEKVPQQALRLVHGGQEIGIEVADARGGHGLQHARRHVTRARPHQHAGPRIDIAKLVGINRHVWILLRLRP